MTASALFAFFMNALSPEDFLDWGWRYPFFVAFAINVVALFARLRIVVTPEYLALFESRALQPSAVGETLRVEGRHVAIGAFAPLASFGLVSHRHRLSAFLGAAVHAPAAGSFSHHRDDRAAIGVVAVVASGPIADRIGRRMLLGVTAGA